MKIMYLADFENLSGRMHKISWLKLQALQAQGDFVCVDRKVVQFSSLGRERLAELVKKHQADIVVHDALWGVGSLLASWEKVGVPRVLMVEDYTPFLKNITYMRRMKMFEHFITIPMVAHKAIEESTWIGHYIPAWFNDYNMPKTADVLFYGQKDTVDAAGELVYPFRKRLCELMAKQKDLRFRVVPPRGHFYTGTEYVGENMARTINQAHLCISCTTAHNYMVKKYLEIPACKSTVLGDVNEECRKVYPRNEGILVVSPSDSDEEIMEKVRKFLEKPKASKKAFDIARGRNPENYAKKLREVCGDIMGEWL